MKHLSAIPPPMPGVGEAQLDISEAITALERAAQAWRPTQLEDAIRSARFFLDKAEAHLREVP